MLATKKSFKADILSISPLPEQMKKGKHWQRVDAQNVSFETLN